MRYFKTLLIFAAASAMMSSCRTPKDITYVQGFENGQTIATSPVKEITAQPGDHLSILVHSRNGELSDLFNLPIVTRRAGQNINVGQARTNYVTGETSGYVVDNFGDIEFPVLGTIHIGGMSRHQIADLIKNELISRDLVKDPTVTVEFTDHALNVLGSVGKPGRIVFDRDRVNVLEAISMAGDLTIDGQRSNVRVFRMEDGKQKAYTIDLTDPQSLYSSPAFYLQQNDVIYVEPNDTKKRTATSAGNSALTPAFWISLASLATTITALIIK